jgi:predicted Zn-dependent peptidase
LEKVIETILQEFKRLKTESVSEEELRRVKSHLSGSVLLGLETSDSIAVFYGMQEILNEHVTSPDELLKAINDVTREQIKDLANELFVPNHLNLAIIGPSNDEKTFQKILSI